MKATAPFAYAYLPEDSWDHNYDGIDKSDNAMDISKMQENKEDIDTYDTESPGLTRRW